jgi:DNA-binding MarR family transcriptional regulator
MQTEDDFELTRFLPYLIGRIGVYLNTVIGVELQAQGLTLPMWRVVGVLWQLKTCSMGELSDVAAIEITALSRLVGAMERKELVERKRSPKDARVVLVTLSRRGRAVARKLIPPSLAMERRVFAKLSATDVRALRASLLTVYESLGDDLKAKT